jgi:DNA-binding transcriptional regulator GbsR (MarR family)
MTLSRFINHLGVLYARVGRSELEGRFVALLLLTETTVAVNEAANQLGVTRQALHRLAVAMLERGDVKREEEFSTKRHLYSLADHAYSRDLRIHLDTSLEIARSARAMLEVVPTKSECAKRLHKHAELNQRVVEALSGLVREEEAAQGADLEKHLERNWDAVPARKGPGRSPTAARSMRAKRLQASD